LLQGRLPTAAAGQGRLGPHRVLPARPVRPSRVIPGPASPADLPLGATPPHRLPRRGALRVHCSGHAGTPLPAALPAGTALLRRLPRPPVAPFAAPLLLHRRGVAR